MDNEKAIEEVEAFRGAVARYDDAVAQSSGLTGVWHPEPDDRRTAVNELLPLIEAIAEQVDPRLPVRIRAWNHSTSRDGRNAIDELAGMLSGRQRRDEVLGPEGPKLAAKNMHPWVWDHAARLWDDGHRREAVQAAATAILDSHLPAKLGVPKGDPLQLVSMAFDTDPPVPGKVRLRIPGHAPASRDWTNAHNGAKHLGQACVEAVRNIATHTTVQPDEDEALESLAALSLFARWVDMAAKDPL